MAAALAFLLVLNFKKHKKYKYADLTKYLVLLVIINAELTITYEKSPFGLFAEFSICPS
ncbi:hypothetical protein [Lactobacillus helveticus]|nr:hypothetical protein [Lactobacillus helveticus]